MNDSDAIIDALGELKGLHPGSEMPAHERLDAIRGLITSSLAPVRPLPSNGALVLLAVAGFIAFSALVTIPLGFNGFHHLSANQKLAYYAVILLSAALLSAAIIQDMIPGSKRRLPPGSAIVLPVVALALVVFVLFPRLDFAHFIELGLPCLETGILCAAGSGLVAYLLLRRGFSASPVRMATTAGLLAGLAGVAVLALHCPLQNVAHIAVWHLGPMLTAAAAGGLFGLWRPGPRGIKLKD